MPQEKSGHSFPPFARATAGRSIDLCAECAPSPGFEHVSIEQLKAFSVVGKNCDFCGEAAVSGQSTAGGGAVYWCSDCGTEFGQIVTELVKSERPDLVQPNMEIGRASCRERV